MAAVKTLKTINMKKESKVLLFWFSQTSCNSIYLFQNLTENNFSRDFEETPTWAAVVTVLGYALLTVLGWLRDFLRNIGLEDKKTAQDPNPKVFNFFLHMSNNC